MYDLNCENPIMGIIPYHLSINKNMKKKKKKRNGKKICSTIEGSGVPTRNCKKGPEVPNSNSGPSGPSRKTVKNCLGTLAS